MAPTEISMSRVRTGLESFLDPASGAAGLPRGARVGVVAHPASIDAGGRHLVDRLVRDGRFRVTRLFGPEHGVRGEAQDMEAVAEPADRATGLPVVSLYGDAETSLRPKPEQLSGLDAIVYDLQDVGTRFYTFVYTLSYVMEAARDADIPVVVLDRPNPIGGVAVEGPVLDPSLASFVGRFPIPVRHGMTTGELARLFRDAYSIGGDLRVVPLSGWTRDMHYEDTGPSLGPSVPEYAHPRHRARLSGGMPDRGNEPLGGRGTTRPFELVGAPWIDAAAFADALAQAGDAEGLDGVSFRAAWFRPTFQKHAGRVCGGVQVHVTDRDGAAVCDVPRADPGGATTAPDCSTGAASVTSSSTTGWRSTCCWAAPICADARGRSDAPEMEASWARSWRHFLASASGSSSITIDRDRRAQSGANRRHREDARVATRQPRSRSSARAGRS
jgi:uncharacterized protein YbbC (DUF1343 family)